MCPVPPGRTGVTQMRGSHRMAAAGGTDALARIPDARQDRRQFLESNRAVGEPPPGVWEPVAGVGSVVWSADSDPVQDRLDSLLGKRAAGRHHHSHGLRPQEFLRQQAPG